MKKQLLPTANHTPHIVMSLNEKLIFVSTYIINILTNIYNMQKFHIGTAPIELSFFITFTLLLPICNLPLRFL